MNGHFIRYNNFGSGLFRFVTIHAFDRRTELLWQYRALHYMQLHGIYDDVDDYNDDDDDDDDDDDGGGGGGGDTEPM